MKIFDTIQNRYATLGISRSYQSAQKYPFNERVLFGFLFFGWTIFSQFVYIFHVARKFLEYMEGTCAAAGCIMLFVCFATIVFKRTSLFENIENFEKLIDTSKTTVWFTVLWFHKKAKSQKMKLFRFFQDVIIQYQRHSFSMPVNAWNDCVKLFLMWS